jgi:cob(I)alamin adenosyltransferase
MTKTAFYTGKGDRGDTARLGGQARVRKSDVLLEAVGSVDEVSAAIGWARSLCRSPLLKERLPIVQRHLYRLMSHLSAAPEVRETYPGLGEDEVAWLEASIARLEDDLPPLRDFVLPGDSRAGAACHVARTVIRRAERRIVALDEAGAGLRAPNLAYVNRLSSLMFVAALKEDALAGRAPTLAKDQPDAD